MPYVVMVSGYFSGSASVETDFIRVDVVTSSGDIKTDVHMHVFPKKEVLRRQSKPGRIPLNVALIMFDSTSAVNFQRKMPHSLNYLVKNMTSILFQGGLPLVHFRVSAVAVDCAKDRPYVAFLMITFMCLKLDFHTSSVKN